MGSLFLEIESINYDYIPSQLESPKMLWVDLKYPPPRDFRVDTLVRFHIKPGVGIKTSSDPSMNSTFYVNDIIGFRVMLLPSTKGWKPNHTKDGCNPFGWGYNLRQMNVRPLRQNWLYGYGTSMSFLEYHPVSYTQAPML